MQTKKGEKNYYSPLEDGSPLYPKETCAEKKNRAKENGKGSRSSMNPMKKKIMKNIPAITVAI